MADHPQIPGIPFNSTRGDANGFAPVYEPEAIRFARKVNFAIGAVIAVALLIPLWMLFTGPISTVNAARVPGNFGDTAVAALLNFVLPIFLMALAGLIILKLTPRIGFDLPRAYQATAEALRQWLPAAAGEFPREKGSLREELNENFSNLEDVFRQALEADSESTLYAGAKQISQGNTQERVSLFSREQRTSYLRFDPTERLYRFES